MFTSKEALRWVLFVRSIDVRGWELHLRIPRRNDNNHPFRSHSCSFANACSNGDIDIVKAMMERTQVDVNAMNSHGYRQLNIAANHGRLSVVQYMCEQGADKEARGQHDLTPLCWTVFSGHLSVMQYLCEQGADKDGTDRTPLQVAAGHGHIHVRQYLCEQGAGMMVTDRGRHWTLLQWVAELHPDQASLPVRAVAKYLCDQGADLIALDFEGKSMRRAPVGPIPL